MDEYRKTNQEWWDERTTFHPDTEEYNLPDFLQNPYRLKTIERTELGDAVAGKSLLHLQCHFGLDTLSWIKHGATVTGVDFSAKAITLAQEISQQLNLPATFVQSDIYALPQNLTGQFDVVFTSYGVLAWLSDLTEWGRVIAHFLKPGGTFYMVEFHPLVSVFSDDDTPAPQVGYPYFDTAPLAFNSPGSYANPEAKTEKNRTYQWNHPLSTIINSLLQAGLQLEYLHEHDYIVFPAIPCLQQHGDGYWHWPENPLPLMFSLKATKS